MTDQINPTLNTAESLFKDTVWGAVKEAGLAALFVAIPGFNIWPLRPIIKFIVEKFSDQLFEAMRLVLDLQIISLQNSANKNAFDHAAVKLRVLALEKGIDSPEFKQAREDAKKELSKYVYFPH